MIFDLKEQILKILFGENTIYYINGPQKLPPPLSREEEEQIFSLLTKGDKAAAEKLIVHNLRLVVYIAKKFENTGIGIDDLTSIGTMGLIKAVNSFSPEKNIKFATYASRCIENEILMYLRKRSNRNVDISMDEALSTDSDGNELNLIDVLYADGSEVSENIESESDRQMVWQSLKCLSQR